jgi:hypothetical protein
VVTAVAARGRRSYNGSAPSLRSRLQAAKPLGGTGAAAEGFAAWTPLLQRPGARP